jgi:PAS domain S-box-containing protein
MKDEAKSKEQLIAELISLRQQVSELKIVEAERKQVAEMLRESEEALREAHDKLSATLNALPDLLFETDSDGRIYDFRAPDPEFLYLPPEDFLGKTVKQVLPEEAASIIMKAIDQAVETGRHTGAIYSLETSAGLHWFELSIAAMGDPNTPEGRLLTLARDITDRKQAEGTLQDNVHEFKIAYKQATIYAQELTKEIIERKQAEKEIQKLNEELEQRVADRTRDLSVLYEVTMVASESLDLKATLERSLERVLAAMNSRIGHIHLLNEKEETLHLVVQRGFSSKVAGQIDCIPRGSGLAGWVIEHGEPLLVPDIATDPRAIQVANGNNLAYVGVPMRARGQVLGVLSILTEAGQLFNAEEVALLASVADQVGVAVENIRLRQQAERAAVVEERERLARELHDSVTQLLYSLTLFAEAGEELVETGDLKATKHNLVRIGETAYQALKEMRLLVYELRPPDLEREGLISVLHQRLSAVERRVNMKARLVAEELVELPAPVEEGLYRISQEALNNVLKHATAASVTVYLRVQGEQLELEVVDDGIGFDPTATDNTGGIGLVSMRERVDKLGGSLTIHSAPGEGTKVKVSLKISNGS